MTIFTNLSSRFLRFKSFCRLVFSFLFRIPLLPFIWLGRWLWWCGIQLRRDPGLVFIVLGLLAVFFFSHLPRFAYAVRSEEHTSELQSRGHLVCRLLLEKKNKIGREHVRTEVTLRTRMPS